MGNAGTKNMPWAWIKKVDEMIDRTLAKKVELPVEIMPSLFLSDDRSVLDIKKLKSLGITHVLSVNGVPSYKGRHISNVYEDNKISHLRVHAEDSEGYGMLEKHWNQCFEFISTAIEGNSNARVSVNCAAGVNRSGLIVCAAYMVLEKVELIQALEHCIEKRGLILTNKSFQKELCIFADEMNLLGEKPAGMNDDPIPDNYYLAPPPTAYSKAFDALT